YLIDALEMPSKQLLSNPLLAQALSITEAAALVYSVRDEASFRLALGLADFMREHFAPNSQHGQAGGRVYPLLLVGNKTDPPPSPPPADPVAQLQGERAVSRAEGAQAARGMGIPGVSDLASSSSGVGFLEVSAKTGEGVERIFEELGAEVLRVRRAVREGRERMERERERERVKGGVANGEGSGRGAGGMEGRRKAGWRRLWFGGRRGTQTVGGEGR
ncbi:hypothetical protein C8A05DRAFT_12076, partial [Staphylotrichum tortipilum]